jgi:CubicO group peptidase (beta-lactamase class C family)
MIPLLILEKTKIKHKIYIERVLLLAFMFVLVSCGLFESESEISVVKVGTAGFSLVKIREAAAYADGSGMILRGNKVVYQWGDVNKLYDLKSTTKSIGVAALGLAINDGLIKLDDKIDEYCSDLEISTGKNRVANWIKELTFFHLASHTGGFDKPGGYAPLLYEPGSAWAYSDGGTNWLADCLTILYRRDLSEVLFDRVFTPLGISSLDLIWRENQYREKKLKGVTRREFGSGIHANVKAMATIGQFFLQRGNWNDRQIISKDFIDILRKPLASIASLPVKNDKEAEFEGASRHYGLLWWNNGDGTIQNVPKDAFWSWGLYDSVILVIPSLDIVVARAGETIKGDRSPSNYRILEPFFSSIVKSVNYGAPYPNSELIANMVWEDPSGIIRKGEGSDTWPITWADDDNLYTAFADGWGFEPKIPEKLSMGFAKIKGMPPDIEGINIRSGDEQSGDGRRGKKASGMLMVDGILYIWVRNADNDGKQSQLAWSDDYGKTWTWASWVFEEFGYCTFINYGKNYEGSRDNFVYMVTHDSPDAYQAADRFILMRTHKKQIKDRNTYEFFAGVDSHGTPIWTKDIEKHDAIFEHTGNCFRSGITYNTGLQRYFWWQVKFPENADKSASMFHSRETDPRYVGVFGVFEAPEPWGPWSTVFYTENWDAGAGESGSFPTKWISGDGKTMHLVFSGNDYFSVRKANIVISPDKK